MPKLSIYLSDDTAHLLGAPDNVSGRLSSIIQRYEIMFEAVRPSLSAAEWRRLDRAVNEEWLRGATRDHLRTLWALVNPRDGLAAKLQVMGIAELMAVVEELERRRATPATTAAVGTGG